MASGSNLVTHGAYRVERLIRADEVDGRTRLGRRMRDLRLGFAIALGYPTWTGAPVPVREAIKNACRLALLCERLFSGFWQGDEVNQKFYTASENLRRQLSDLGLEPRLVEPDVAAVLARMRAEEAKG